MTRYFAYGSNLHPVRLTERVPTARLVATCQLGGWKLRFHKVGFHDGSGKADIVPDPGHQVFGALFEIGDEDPEILDRAEGAGSGYDRHQIDLGAHGHAFTYRAHPGHIRPHVHPFSWYRDLVLAGALFHQFPSAYLRQIRRVETREDHNPERDRVHRDLLGRIARKN